MQTASAAAQRQGDQQHGGAQGDQPAGRGVRDGAVARATHDYLHLQRGGKVSAELFIVSVDLVTNTLVVSRNARCPVLISCSDRLFWLEEPSEAVGIHANTKPRITETHLQAGMTLLVFTDGVWAAGSRQGLSIDLPALLARSHADGLNTASRLADAVLAEALRLDDNRPADDATVLVVQVTPRAQLDDVRRLQMRFRSEWTSRLRDSQSNRNLEEIRRLVPS
ncbi:MAG: SpoIIE family protein phosphatase [Caldilineaceae bacterium]|nr:SpoIIE family protein phosphatase [Caldilineaceae bacterium]